MVALTRSGSIPLEVQRDAAVKASFLTVLSADSVSVLAEQLEILREKSAPSTFLQVLQRSQNHQVKQVLEHLRGLQDGTRPLEGKKVVIIGAGPGGLLSAVKARCLGADVTIVDKKQEFTRHNVLKLWAGVVDELYRNGIK